MSRRTKADLAGIVAQEFRDELAEHRDALDRPPVAPVPAHEPERRVHSLAYRERVGRLACSSVALHGDDHEAALDYVRACAIVCREDGRAVHAEIWDDVAALLDRRARTLATSAR